MINKDSHISQVDGGKVWVPPQQEVTGGKVGTPISSARKVLEFVIRNGEMITLFGCLGVIGVSAIFNH